MRVEFGRQICDQIGPDKKMDPAAQKLVWPAKKLVWKTQKPKKGKNKKLIFFVVIQNFDELFSTVGLPKTLVHLL